MYDDRRTKLWISMTTQTADQIPHPARDEIELGAFLHALSVPVGMKSGAARARAAAEPTWGSFAVRVTKSTCPHHFRVLGGGGVTHQRRGGPARRNALRR